MVPIALVIPSHNRPALARRAVRNALRQPFEEVVVVDDASDPPLVLDVADSRLRLVRHSTNRGVSAARNTGIASTRASYLTFLDDDDRLLPLAARLLAHWLAQAPADHLVVGGLIVEARGRLPEWRRPPSSQPGEIWGLDRHLQASGRSWATKQAAAIPRALLERIGGWDEALRSRATSEMFYRLTAIAGVVGHPWPIYRLNRGPHQKLTADPTRRERSMAHIRRKHAELLSDPARRATLEARHSHMMARTMAARPISKDRP